MAAQNGDATTVAAVTSTTTFDNELSFMAQLAGDAAGRMRKSARVAVGTRKPDGSRVTSVDTSINDHVIDAVARRFPSHGVIGEERSLPTSSSRQFVVDPIDGTLGYCAHISTSCFSLALIEDGQPVAAIVADPWADATWTATIHDATRRDGTLCHVDDTSTLEHAIIDVESHHYGQFADLLGNQRANPLRLSATVRAGAAVADGSFAGVLYNHGRTWDVAAISLLISQAGGRVGHTDRSDIRYDGEVGAWLGTAPALWDTIADMWEHNLQR